MNYTDTILQQVFQGQSQSAQRSSQPAKSRAFRVADYVQDEKLRGQSSPLYKSFRWPAGGPPAGTSSASDAGGGDPPPVDVGAGDGTVNPFDKLIDDVVNDVMNAQNPQTPQEETPPPSAPGGVGGIGVVPGTDYGGITGGRHPIYDKNGKIIGYKEDAVKAKSGLSAGRIG